MGYTVEELKEYLEILSGMAGNSNFKYSSIYDFILKNGKEYEIKKGLPAGIARGPLGSCFETVSNIVILNDIKSRYTYVEGVAFSTTIPMTHAWIVDKDDNAWDPVWKNGTAYFGCEFPSWYVRHQIIKQEEYSSMIDNWKGRFPLLTGEHAYPIVRAKIWTN